MAKQNKSKLPNKNCKKGKDKYSEARKEVQKALETEKKNTNGPEFYNVNPQLVQDGATLPYSNMLGLKASLRDDVKSAIPGICIHEYVHTIGVSNSNTSNVNVTSRNIQTYVRHWNSGSSNYEAPDLMMMLLACGSIVDFLSSMRRIYGIMMTYSVTNRYWSKYLVQALGWNYEDVLANLAQLRYSYNTAAIKFARIAIPKNIYYYDRCNMLQNHIYVDGPTNKAQLHAFKARSYYQFDGYGSSTGSRLVETQITGEITVAKATQFIHSLLDALLSNEDIGIMSGDILKAYGEGNLYVVPVIDEKYTVTPVYDENVLEQIMNLTSIALPKGLEVKQQDGYIVCRPYIANVQGLKSEFAGSHIGRMINTFREHPTALDNLEITRLSYTIGSQETIGTDENSAYVLSCGTEIIVRSLVYTMDYDAGDLIITEGHTIGDETMLPFIADINCFDYRPIVYVLPEATQGVSAFVGPVQNYVLVSSDVIERLHNVALLSLFTSYGTKTF